MKLEVDTSTVASAVFSIITVTIFSSFSKVFSETIIFYLGIPFALTIFLFSLIVLRRDNKGWAFKITMHNPQTFIGALITLSVLAVTLIPPYTGSALGWMSIPSMNWLRYVASLLLTTFFPGYFLVKILDRKRDITGSIIIVLSYLLSLFTMFVIGFFILLSGNSMSLFGSTAVVAINLAMIVIYHFTHGKNARGHSLTVNGHRMILISSILMAIMVGALITMISNLPLTPGDMQRHHGLALQYFNCFPIHGGKLMPPYPYLFHIYLAVLFSLAGIPSVLVEQGLFTLSFMPLLAFYCAIKTWFNKREDQKILSIAILLSILLGFGGLYAIYSRFANPAYDVLQLLANTTLKTYDIGMRCLYLPDIVAPVWNIGLPTFFALLYLLKKRVAKIAKATLIPVLVALGYLGHISETFFFILILLIYVLFSKPDNEKNIGLYIILGLIITAFIDLAAPAQIYVFSSS
ncbi:hypothetical protein KAU92_03790, partial [Candidatus Bathyarchaeota archaeon]|nr:hypothetical protein [Candidatus Bathyarchaeota archaeon]